jgi:pimeloyl-ACP methyl ester carboxylesterase
VGIGPWGTLNTAGNVREWVWNRAGDKAVALGGGWTDYASTYQAFYTTRPMDRSPELGIRLMRALEPIPDELLTPIAVPIDEEYMRRKPVSNDAFEAMRFQFTTGSRTPSNVSVEVVEKTDAWVAEEVVLTFAPNETFTLYVVKPLDRRGPLQPVLYAPPGDAPALRLPNRKVLNQMRFGNVVISTGRALVLPIWSGTYERWVGVPQDPQQAYDQLRLGALNWYADATKTLAYLTTRDDIDMGRLGLLAVSFGAVNITPPILALDGRFKAGIFVGAGITTSRTHPMDDAVNYAPRIHCPMLMINGSYDSIFPSDISQARLFALLGSPDGDKRHVVYEVGHFDYPRNQMLKEISDWYDRYLGTVSN